MTLLQGFEQKELGAEKFYFPRKKIPVCEKIGVSFIFGHLELRVE